MFTLLIVEDDPALSEMLNRFLTSKKFTVKQARNGKQALKKLGKINPDLMLLDWMLPDLSGPEIIKKIRRNKVQKDIPIIMLTARAEESDKIKGLETGADDYITKPLSLQELYARINALIRRAQGLSIEKTLKLGLIALDPNDNYLKINNQNVKIGKTEFKLLHYFMRRADRLLTRTQLLDQVWGAGRFIEERTVDVHVLRLRKLLKPYGVDYMLKTVHGLGYRFSEKK